MAAIDTPPGLGLAGAQVGWFVARPGPRRLAGRGLVGTVALAVVAALLTRRQPPADYGAARLIVLVTAVAIAALAWAVRRARVGVGPDGVRWGWGTLVVRLDARRVTAVRVYLDAIAFVPRRGSAWFLFARDWDRFEALRRAVVTAGLPCAELDRRAPWTARLQSYGRVLDLLVVGAVAVAALTAIVAL
ncbi:MAG: hypothetical protein IPH44_15965 [Myxococcales bacterium]|nr:hypothetical protein [Myxococcales bacterium]MBK7195667.1 hypothetical protein [Myxococcales bacterium]MBP6849013.1 hypothetical protein [Kofleriaceae bacterium]